MASTIVRLAGKPAATERLTNRLLWKSDDYGFLILAKHPAHSVWIATRGLAPLVCVPATRQCAGLGPLSLHPERSDSRLLPWPLRSQLLFDIHMLHSEFPAAHIHVRRLSAFRPARQSSPGNRSPASQSRL